MAVNEQLNQYNDGAAFWRGGEERIWHDVDAGGNCRVPWCDYSSEVEGSEHISLDQAINEPGRYNLFKSESRLRQMMEERSSLLSYIWDTHGERAELLEKSGVEGWVSLSIGIMENLRDQLDSLTSDKSDSMRPEARRNVTMNDLRTTLLGMLLSGCDVALKDLDAYLEQYVQAVNSIVRRSVDLEKDPECCIGCTEHRYSDDPAVKKLRH